MRPCAGTQYDAVCDIASIEDIEAEQTGEEPQGR